MKKTKYLKPGLLFLSLALFLATASRANNIIVDNVSLTGQNTVNHTTSVRFDISWENSWRTSTAPNNWDAAWVFIKFRVGSGNWKHATLNSANHLAPEGSTINTPADKTGVFIYRSVNGTGTFSLTGVKLSWDYAVDGVGDNDVVDVKVFAIEMVYVPQGSFYVGNGASYASPFYTYPTTNSSFPIVDEGAISVGTTAGYLYYASGGSDQGDQSGPIPAAFPKGYHAMYCMKYEITQQDYVDFLNMLSRDQQNTRTTVNLASGISSVTNRYVLTNTSTMVDRNCIRCDATINAVNPISFYCDYNGNGIGGEPGDGLFIACNYINWADLAAYLDWAALRPMTELEFEKICRGPGPAVAAEYVWGASSGLSLTNQINNPGQNNESGSAGSNVSSNNGVAGPMRVGSFSTATSTRVQSGSCYYGAFDMSGNAWERPVTVGNAIGRSFTGLHGDGSLSASGDANVANWPGIDAIGGGFRGGWWGLSNTYLPTSARGYASHEGSLRRERMGGRGIRTAE